MGALSLTRENALVFILVILVWCVIPARAMRQEPKGKKSVLFIFPIR